MVKLLDVYLRRHMESYTDPSGRKHDGPSLDGINEALAVGRGIRDAIPDGGILFYTSPMYRTQIAAQLIAEAAGIGIGFHIIAPELGLMRRSDVFKARMEETTGGVEDLVVAYCLDSANHQSGDVGTETPAQFGDRYLGHVRGLQRLFEVLNEGSEMRIESLCHEPGLTATMMRVLRLPSYDATVFLGAAKTAEAVHFRMEQTGSGIVKVTAEYRDLKHQFNI